MSRCLIHGIGFIGDSLFALSLFEKIKEEQKYDYIDYICPRQETINLIRNNAYVDNVLTFVKDVTIYDKIYNLEPMVDWTFSPPERMQETCGIINKSPQFYSNIPDSIYERVSSSLKTDIGDRPLITYQGDWNKRRWNLTPEERKHKKLITTRPKIVDTSYMPYDIFPVINRLKASFKEIEFRPISKDHAGVKNKTYYSVTDLFDDNAAVIKHSKLYLGAEGGLGNLSASLKVKTILDTNHMFMMFGPQGAMFQCEDPQLGPEKLFPGENHINLDPYLDNDEIYDILHKEISKL